jgi:hypothetical protein
MPRSAVIYTDPESFTRLKERMRLRFEDEAVKPYTFSYPQKTDAGSIRVRATELVEGVLEEELIGLTGQGKASLASGADRDVRGASYEELMEDADRARTETILQFASPVIVETQGALTPFPVLAVIFPQYIAVWNVFSRKKIDAGKAGLAHVHVADFKLSCVTTAFGPGSQGWARLEMEKGQTEEAIALFNGLADFAFYCGTGLHAHEGLGQTRRMEKKG